MSAWVKISGFPNYAISDSGSVIRLSTGHGHTKAGKVLRPFPKKAGYLYVRLFADGVRRDFLVSRLVAIAFLENPDNLPEVNHKDGNKANNGYGNLEWSSRLSNMRHSAATGLRDSCRKLSAKQVGEVRALRAAGKSLRDIARRYGVAHGLIGNIVRGVTYLGVAC